MSKMRIKAKEKKGVTTVKVLAKHPMTSYAEAKKKKTKANYMTSMIGKVGSETVYEVSTSPQLSKNPYMKFKFKGAYKGKKIEMTWTDLSGASKSKSKKIK
jgi:sulfur-oxidizing protein SoxZ